MRPRTRIVTITAAAVLAAGATTALLLANPSSSSPAAGSPSTPPATTSPSGPTSASPATTSPSGPAPLTTQGLTYVNRTWGDPKTELGVIVPIPSTWSMTKVSTFESRFTSPNKLWNLRLNGVLAKPQPRATYVTQKLAALRSTPDFHLISRTHSAAKATSEVFAGVTFQYTTLTYTYTDPARGTRLVVDRFVTIDDATTTGFELAASGRPEDLPALRTITTKVTLGYVRLP
ncbi:hypothetical protein [Kribbella lupini]|uniref:DUF1795 domain-containing protein n=1 Tax=Kribbella lupini TaxID=291602 RepID=A0ABP4MBL3_9ACTN